MNGESFLWMGYLTSIFRSLWLSVFGGLESSSVERKTGSIQTSAATSRFIWETNMEKQQITHLGRGVFFRLGIVVVPPIYGEIGDGTVITVHATVHGHGLRR